MSHDFAYEDFVPTRRTMYYTGTATLPAGLPLFLADTAGAGGRNLRVTTATSSNRHLFVGYVPDIMGGFTGPGKLEVTIPQPGEVHEMLVSNKVAGASTSYVRLDETFNSSSSSVSGQGALLPFAVADSANKAFAVLLDSFASAASATRSLRRVFFPMRTGRGDL